MGEWMEEFVAGLDRPEKGNDQRAETAESTAIILHYMERCAFTHSETYKDRVRNGEFEEYITLDRYPMSTQISYGTTKSPNKIGGVVNSQIAELYGKEDLRHACSGSSTWNFRELIDDAAVDPQEVRQHIEKAYDIDVSDYLVDPQEQDDEELSNVEQDKKMKNVRPWHEKIPDPEEVITEKKVPAVVQ